MTRLKLFALFVLSGIALFSACKGDVGTITASSNDTLKSIPADASAVTKVNPQNIMDKMDFEAVKKMEFYQDALREMRQESEIGAKIMQDPALSGVDLSKNIYMAYDIDPKVIGNMFSYAAMSLKDATAFEAMLQEAGVNGIEDKAGFKMASPKRKQVVAWSDEMAIVGTASSYMDLEAPVTKIFTTKKENSLATNKDFVKRMKGNHDMNVWFSSNTIAENPDAKMAVGFMNIKPIALKDNYSYGYVDFKDGAVVSQSQFDMHDELSKDLNRFFKDESATNFGKLVPGQNMGFGMTTALDLKGINQVLSERPQAKSMANFSLRKFGIEVDQIVKAFGGDVFIGGYGKTGNADGAGLVATNIADEATFGELIKAAEEFGLVNKVGDDLYGLSRMVGGRGNQILVKKGVLYAGNAALISKVQSGDYSSSDFSKRVKNVSADNVFSLVTDFDVFKGGVMKDLEKFGGRYVELTSDRGETDFKMEFEDKNTNALEQIMVLMNEIYLQGNKRR